MVNESIAYGKWCKIVDRFEHIKIKTIFKRVVSKQNSTNQRRHVNSRLIERHTLSTTNARRKIHEIIHIKILLFFFFISHDAQWWRRNGSETKLKMKHRNRKKKKQKSRLVAHWLRLSPEQNRVINIRHDYKPTDKPNERTHSCDNTSFTSTFWLRLFFLSHSLYFFFVFIAVVVQMEQR